MDFVFFIHFLLLFSSIIKAFVKHARDVKRIAPYFLLFVINLMISKENVSTMYSKVSVFTFVKLQLSSVVKI